MTLKKTASLILAVSVAASGALAQASGSHVQKQQVPPVQGRAPATPAVKRPSTEELSGFMQHMFGYDPTVKWKVESVKPSEVPGITEVVITFGDPVQQRTPFYVASDLQHAFVGQI